MMAAKSRQSGAHWWMLALTGLLFGLVAIFVDLKPAVDESFFFSSKDPQFRQSKKIEEEFPSRPEVILNVSSGDISSSRYLSRIAKLTREMQDLDAVSSVKSLTNGPKSYSDAVASPFWSRLLIAEDRKSSNVIVFIGGKDSTEPIARMEQIIHGMDEKDFRIHIAGSPYVVEMIRRSLTHDFWYFSLTAVVLFGITMWAMFRSARVLLGMLATCSSAVLLTLLLQSIFGGRIGILTVNLGTIVSVVTLSHLVYMTFNWQTLADRKGRESSNLAAAARTRIRRRTRDVRRAGLCLCDVSAVFALGRSAGEQTYRARTAPRFLVATISNVLDRHHSD
jgi:predicted RND superfamily exporter protein